MLEGLIKEIRNSQKTLWILCGLPYSGKTYISNKIVESVSISYISIDHILEELGFDWDTGRLPDADGWKRVFDISYERSKESLKNNLNVLYDSTNHTKASRDVLRKVAQEVGASTKVIYIDVSVETIWKRWEENVVNKSRSVVAKDLVEQTIESFESPTSGENVYSLQSEG